MADILPLLLKCVLSLAISAIVIRILQRHLAALLQRLCQDATAAAFWRDYTWLTLAMVPLVLLIISDWLFWDADVVDNLRVSLLSILGGLLFGLIKIKRHIDRFISIPANDSSTASKQGPAE
ncbi:hypothetical protein [Aquitalea pelogenes]|uniref:hypothetical protein n=1 Tax=Aquitalea pelogenes TaxID=1293573 RepID=UPI00078936C2|nr:hypothetical protein [Aquitalea pelogenes]